MATTITTDTIHFSGISSDHSYYSISNTSNAYSGDSSYANIICTTGRNAVTYFYFTFNTSSLNIPQDATSITVTCSVKSKVNATGTNISAATMQMASGTTLKGSSTSFRSQTASFRDIDAGTDWSVSDLSNLSVYFSVTRGTSNTTNTAYGAQVYNANLTISYEAGGANYSVSVKVNGAWKEADAVYVKADGAWKEADSIGVKVNGTWK